MIIYVDIDETICLTPDDRDYSHACPLPQRIAKINDLYAAGNKVIYWTARGSATKADWESLTRSQLSSWGAKYHELKFDKPVYDLFVDDKNESSDSWFQCVSGGVLVSHPPELNDDLDNRVFKPLIVEKGWGHEKWMVNGPEYCGKLLFIEEGKRCSWHYHELKDEVFYVQSGSVVVKYSAGDDLDAARQVVLSPGDNFHVYRGLRHQMIALKDTELFEFSTSHYDSDSHRIAKGD